MMSQYVYGLTNTCTMYSMYSLVPHLTDNSAAEDVSPDGKKKVMVIALNISQGLQWCAER